ncbi:MAG: cytochrome c3 family protein [Elusimicrobiota bacterium]|jgi:hypothetical protein
MALSARAWDLAAAASGLWDLLRQRRVQTTLASAAGLIGLTVLATGWLTQTDLLARDFAPEQPLPFSHRDHAGAQSIPCLLCHGGAAKSRRAGIPDAELCMACHKVTRTDAPSIVNLKKAWDTGEPVRWRRVHSLPSHVFFDHRPHVHAGIACQTCHGKVESMAKVRQVMNLRMSACLACHRDSKAPENCNACHR